MSKQLHLLADRQDKIIVETLASQPLKQGIVVFQRVRERFPIADPLSSLLAALNNDDNVVVVIISQQSRQTEWLLLELRNQRELYSQPHGARFMVFFTTPNAKPPWIMDEDVSYWIGPTLSVVQDKIVLALLL